MTRLTMLLTFTLTALTATAATAINVTATNTTAKEDLPTFLRGRHHYPPHRGLVLRNPNKSSGESSHQSTYQGCLGYSDSELSESWIFSGDAPSCSWVHSSGSSGGDSSNGGSSSSSGNSSSGSSSGGGSSSSSSGGGNQSGNGRNDDASSYDGEGDKYGGGWDDDSGNGHDNDNDDGGNTDGNGGYDDDGSGNQAHTDDEVVVSNEDVNGGDDQYDPIDDFDIEVCDTYENLWLWDLALSCDNITESDAGFLSNSGCNCSFAQELMDNDLLTCEEASLCPDDCRVCSICLDLLGCGPEPFIPRVMRSLSALSILYIVGAAVGMLLFGLVAYYSRKHCYIDRRNQNNDDLDQNLLDTKQAKVSPTLLYMHGSDLAWRPLPSDREYAASVQATGTMSTASTGRMSRKKSTVSVHSKSEGSGQVDAQGIHKNAKESEGSFLHGEDLFAQGAPSPHDESVTTIPSTVNTFGRDDGNLSMGVSPIQTLEESSEESSAEGESEEFHDTFDEEANEEFHDTFDDEDPLFEDLSPRSMESTVKSGDEAKEEVL